MSSSFALESILRNINRIFYSKSFFPNSFNHKMAMDIIIIKVPIN